MIGGLGLGAIGLAAAGALAAATVPQAAETAPAADSAVEARADAQGEALGRLIESRLRAEGPFFTAEERAVIDRACGYAPGEWDGFDVNLSDNVLTCTNGRVANDPEIAAVLAAAEPRIEARVQAMMASPDIQQAIQRITETATAEALRGLDLAAAELEGLEIDVDADPGDGVDVDVDVDVDDDPDVDVDVDVDDDGD